MSKRHRRETEAGTGEEGREGRFGLKKVESGLRGRRVLRRVV